MGKNSPMCPNTEISTKRQTAKKKRGFGMQCVGSVSLAEWSKSKDPFYKVKGMERHLKNK